MNPHSVTSFIMGFMLIVSINGCSSTSFLFSTKIKATVITADDINPDSRNRASPIVVRIYELKSVNSFNDTDFFRLYDEEAASLGGDLIAREEFELAPGQGREINRKPNEEARYFGVIAAFRNIDKAQWRVATALKLNKTNSLVIRIGKESVTIQEQ
ncbi:MAG: type VI secretion system lipoprotein TssJ [Thiohalomonadales bacterium]